MMYLHMYFKLGITRFWSPDLDSVQHAVAIIKVARFQILFFSGGLVLFVLFTILDNVKNIYPQEFLFKLPTDIYGICDFLW